MSMMSNYKTSAAIMLCAGTLSPATADAKYESSPATRSASSETTPSVRSKQIMYRIGRKVLTLSRKNIKGQKVMNTAQPGNIRTLTVTNDSRSNSTRRKIGNYTFTASFRGKSSHLKTKNLIQVGTSQAGSAGVFSMLDLRKCGTRGYVFQGEYTDSPDDQPGNILQASTYPQADERALSLEELDQIDLQMTQLVSRAPKHLPLAALAPIFPPPTEPPLPMQCL